MPSSICRRARILKDHRISPTIPTRDIPATLAYVTDPEIVRIQSIPPHYTKAILTAADAQNIAIVGEPGSSFDGVDCTDPQARRAFAALWASASAAAVT